MADLQYSTDGGSTWKSGLSRQPYNYFELSSGTGSDTVAVRAESIDGDRVVVKGCKATGGKSYKAAGNF